MDGDLPLRQVLERADVAPSQLGISPATSPMTFHNFKDAVQSALIETFGRSTVTTRRCLRVRETTTSLNADVVPCFTYRRYTDVRGSYDEGIAFHADDDGGRIINWPAQNLRNGNSKNTQTGHRYKSMVRALKRLENFMVDRGATRPVASYLVECLVWNAPNSAFEHARYVDDMRAVLAHTFNGTLSQDRCQDWGEVNEIKYLFRSQQRWTRDIAHTFLSDSWDYLGFE
jgi:hypothetical protein